MLGTASVTNFSTRALSTRAPTVPATTELRQARTEPERGAATLVVVTLAAKEVTWVHKDVGGIEVHPSQTPVRRWWWKRSRAREERIERVVRSGGSEHTRSNL
jgi:hypothetical protein